MAAQRYGLMVREGLGWFARHLTASQNLLRGSVSSLAREPSPEAELKLPESLPATPKPRVPVSKRLGERDLDRFELKYWLPEPVAEEVTRYASPYLALDPFCAREPSKGQWNFSLYLDTPDFSCYRHHIDAAPDRFKLRVRAYGDPPVGICFFETKRKVKGVIVKTRTPMPLELAYPLLEGTYDELPLLRAEERRNLEGFLYLQAVHQVVPSVLVRCHRQAYASVDLFEDVRMTFDREIAYQPARGHTFEYERNGWTPVNGELQHQQRGGEYVLLELKFPRIAPLWMREVVRKLEMWRVGYSKYCSAVQGMLGQPFTDALERDSISAGE